MRFKVSTVGLSCITLLTACGGGGGGASGNKSQSVDFPYPGARYLASVSAPLSATASSGLAVTFSSNTPQTCTVVDGKLVPVAPGECSITASQAGDGNYASATSQQLFKILKHLQTITFESPGFQAITGTPPALVASSDSGLPVSFASTTPDVCTVSGTTLTLVSKGQCSITASQTGNNDYAPATPQTATFTVDDAPPPVLTFLSGYSSTSATKEGGSIGTWAGSNKDNWWCSDPNWCGSTVSTDGSSFTYHYLIQPTDPNHPNTDNWIGAYYGFEIVAPGVGSISSTGNTTTGLQVGKQTTLKFNLAENSEWFSIVDGNKNPLNGVKITLVLGHYNKKSDNNNCNVAVNTTFMPKSAASQSYALQLASFTGFSDTCELTGLDAATELHTYPIVKIKFEAANANTSVSRTPDPNPTYPTETTLTGSITLQ